LPPESPWPDPPETHGIQLHVKDIERGDNQELAIDGNTENGIMVDANQAVGISMVDIQLQDVEITSNGENGIAMRTVGSTDGNNDDLIWFKNLLIEENNDDGIDLSEDFANTGIKMTAIQSNLNAANGLWIGSAASFGARVDPAESSNIHIYSLSSFSQNGEHGISIEQLNGGMSLTSEYITISENTGNGIEVAAPNEASEGDIVQLYLDGCTIRDNLLH